MNSSEGKMDNLISYNKNFCNAQYRNFTAAYGEFWCNPVWDSLLCWPPTNASSTVKQQCPFVDGFDTTKFVEKKCGYNGRWEIENGMNNGTSKNSLIGWTNYTTCLTSEILELQYKVNDEDNEAKLKLAIAEKTRVMEFVGLSFSLVALFISLIIFCRYRSLRNTRTKIHKNLFVALIMQVLIRLIIYLDIAIFWKKLQETSVPPGIKNIPMLCEATYALLEYTKTVMFTWMFIEAFFLHNMVITSIFQEASNFWIYQLIGWGCPLLITIAWIAMMSLYYHPKLKCWSAYNLSSYFWILEGPRFVLILFNFVFLMNIVRILVMKLRRNYTLEIEQILRTVKATVILLPLLGISNILFMVEAPLDNVKKFAFWSYSTHFLRSFQGFFIAIFYCFFNYELRHALIKAITTHFHLTQPDAENGQ